MFLFSYQTRTLQACLYCVLFFSTVDGGWSKWGEWSQCSSTCQGGVIQRIRVCNNPVQHCSGLSCMEQNNTFKEYAPCNEEVSCKYSYILSNTCIIQFKIPRRLQFLLQKSFHQIEQIVLFYGPTEIIAIFVSFCIIAQS